MSCAFGLSKTVVFKPRTRNDGKIYIVGDGLRQSGSHRNVEGLAREKNPRERSWSYRCSYSSCSKETFRVAPAGRNVIHFKSVIRGQKTKNSHSSAKKVGARGAVTERERSRWERWSVEAQACACECAWKHLLWLTISPQLPHPLSFFCFSHVHRQQPGG